MVFKYLSLLIFAAFLSSGDSALAADNSGKATCRGAVVISKQPLIKRCAIPYSTTRREQMAAYALRHYGFRDFRLRRPQVIVEHYTATRTFPPAYNTFANNSRDPELGELPGTCAHFIVDTDGTIYQLVSPQLMCRHTIGLNWTAIGIEHIGVNEQSVLTNKRQRQASFALTNFLRRRYKIKVSNIIGHAESLSSPFHRERIARLRKRTHGDFTRKYMVPYRRQIARMSHELLTPGR